MKEPSPDNDPKTCVYKQHHSLSFRFEIKSLSSGTSILSLQPDPMAYNTIASLEKLTCTDNMIFAKCQDEFGQFHWPQKDSNLWL